MRIPDDVRKAVLFLGHGDDDHFQSVGTAFLLQYKDCRYLVTAEHIALGLGEDPFAIRVNRMDGTADTISVDPLDPETRARFGWITHPSAEHVDIAVAEFNIDLRGAGNDVLYLPEDILLDGETGGPGHAIGVGDFCYAVGLFRKVGGQKRNVPVVHTGHIALMPSDELIEVEDWRAPPNTRLAHVEAYLAEISNLKGLSGAPVFARPVVDLDMRPILDVTARMLAVDMKLIGVWQSSWDGWGIESDRPTRVPVGMGVVTPTYKLVEVLESSLAVARRNEFLAWCRSEAAAKPDATTIA
jgi:hypothetical protein